MDHLVIVGSLNIRETPGILGKRIGSLMRGNVVRIKPGGEHVGRYFWVQLESIRRGGEWEPMTGWCAMNIVNDAFYYLEPYAGFIAHYHPCSMTRTISQHYGNNPAYYNKFYGPGSPYHNRGHQGVDFACFWREPIVSICDGVIRAIIEERQPKQKNGTGHNFGVHVRVNHAGGYQSLYCHLDERIADLKAGDEIRGGELIGYAGNTGNVWPKPTPGNPRNGTHLHFALRHNALFIDPTNYIKAADNG